MYKEHIKTYKGYDIYIEPDIDTAQMFGEDYSEGADGIITAAWHDSFTTSQDKVSKGELQGYFEGEEECQHLEENWHIFPLHAYVHSGVALSLSPFSCPWDSGMVGAILVPKSETEDEKRAKELAEMRVKQWNELDEMVIVSVEKDGAVEETLGGVVDAIETGKELVEEVIDTKRKEHESKLKQWIQSKVPVQYREPLEV